MTDSISILSYADCEGYFNQALTSDKGIKLTFKDRGQRERFVRRCNKFRALLRKKNASLYPDPGHPFHSACQFDAVQVSKDGELSAVMKKIAPGEDDILVANLL